MMYFKGIQNNNDNLDFYKEKLKKEQRKYNNNIKKRNKIMSKTFKIGGTIAVIISTITYIYSPAVFKVPGILMAIVLGIAVPTFGLWRTWDLKCKIKNNDKMINKYENRIKKLERLGKTNPKQNIINNNPNNKPKYSYEYNPNSKRSQSRPQTPSSNLYYSRNRHR